MTPTLMLFILTLHLETFDPSFNGLVEYLVVGGGGNWYTGSGGGGGVAADIAQVLFK